MKQKEKRNEILERYVESTNPRERRELLKQWAAAGGRNLIDGAVTAGLSSLKGSPDNEDDR